MTRHSRSRVFPSLLGLLALGAAALAAPSEARALDAERAYSTASQQIGSASAGLGAIQAAIQKSRGQERGPAQRIADAVLLMGSKDYARAATVLNEVIEKYPDHPTAYPDALTLLGETYFRSKQFLSARRVFQQIVTRGAEPRFATYQTKALGRLVDVALRTKDYSSLDAIFASMDRVPPAAVGSGLAYARGKGLIARKDYAGAKAALGAVDTQSEYAHQARYMLALIAVKEATPPPQPLAEGEAPPPVPASRYAG
ncbi:MAG: tetratricopeptide repeat protein, partial [Polyangiaceae bacterium]|nr:tetratricopeptide repeat protein [Polyangiaceae bacterium]